jgi:predicted metal-dependent hydrolase
MNWTEESQKVTTATLPPWIARVAADFEPPNSISIENQRTRWGRCSVSGRINLRCKLLLLTRNLVRYAMIHEICHLLEPNHSSRFLAHVRRMNHDADSNHGHRRDAWKSCTCFRAARERYYDDGLHREKTRVVLLLR